ncbi:MAG: hypothetical protein HOO67_07075 [Candidatus Peribacteraceae bacterium]|nr:hypothetical protein [Candidatus Peribacteraceae bacterium]
MTLSAPSTTFGESLSPKVVWRWNARRSVYRLKLRTLWIMSLGIALTVGTVWAPPAVQNLFGAAGPVVGIVLIIFSLFGELPARLSWMQRLGTALFPGVAAGTFLLLLPLLAPVNGRPTSLQAFSPAVWAAYISIVLTGISFEHSPLPNALYHFCQKIGLKPFILIPLYVVVMGLLGNILDGVSIVIISCVLLFNLLPSAWATRALFALLFGGLISNLVTVAAEPTNIKFHETLGPLLHTVTPSFWLTNWPICLFGILVPAAWLGILMARSGVEWKPHEPQTMHIPGDTKRHVTGIFNSGLGVCTVTLLAAGIVAHAIMDTIGTSISVPLWILLLPAGIAAVVHLSSSGVGHVIHHHLREQIPIWFKLMVIFSLLWFIEHGLSGSGMFGFFFLLPPAFQFTLLIVLSLCSAVTDNVALAAMQASIILSHPLAIWQIRLLLVLLTWAGGLTPFGCLQSLSINHRLKFSTNAWLKECPVWAMLSLCGGIAGLLFTFFLYPSAM